MHIYSHCKDRNKTTAQMFNGATSNKQNQVRWALSPCHESSESSLGTCETCSSCYSSPHPSPHFNRVSWDVKKCRKWTAIFGCVILGLLRWGLNNHIYSDWFDHSHPSNVLTGCQATVQLLALHTKAWFNLAKAITLVLDDHKHPGPG